MKNAKCAEGTQRSWINWEILSGTSVDNVDMSNTQGWETFETFFQSDYKKEKAMVENLGEMWKLPKAQVIAIAVRELWKYRDNYKFPTKPWEGTGRKNRTQRILEMEVLRRDSKGSSSSAAIHKDDGD